MQSYSTLALALLAALAVMVSSTQSSAEGATVKLDFLVEEWVVDFFNPTNYKKRPNDRKTPFNIAEDKRKGAILVNGQYPGPTVEVYENDWVEINVINGMISESTSIHWHGVHPVDQPWTDGAVGVSQAPIMPGHNFTYKFRAWPAGTHYWHSHMDGMQSAKGLRGPFIIKKKEDRNAAMYDEEKVIVLADEWQNPDVCLKLEGAMAGNDVCSDIEYASVNGQVALGDLQKFDKKYPYPLVDVEAGKCYRFRYIMMASNAENYIVRLAGHNMTLIALDGVDVEPIQITTLNMHIGERADVVVCADQKPGYYPMEMTYDYACTLTPGHFIPPGFHAVSSCNFFSFLHYSGEREWPFYGAPTSPKGTGGGAHPAAVSGVGFDLTNAEDWKKTHPIEDSSEPEEPDARFVITLGLNGPTFSKPTDRPLTRGRWYMDIDGRRESWTKPATPLLHTKGGSCGAANVPVLNIPENATNIELVLNNLSPTAHNIHMHGMLFSVINVADYEWCNVNKTACFLMPEWLNPCPRDRRGYADEKHTGGLEGFYWGCKYKASEDKKTQNLVNPLRKDSFQLWQRSWAVLRFKADAPGVWQFHCHMEQHIPLGMVMAINVLPSKQKPVPKEVPTEGPCPVWSSDEGKALDGDADAVQQVIAKNAELKQRVKDLTAELDHAQC